MNDKDFDEIVSERLSACQSTLRSKNREYSSDIDRLHNFKAAGRIANTSPEVAAWGMALKHLVSIIDLVEQPGKRSKEAFNEKFTDIINYFLLTEAIMVEQMGQPTDK